MEKYPKVKVKMRQEEAMVKVKVRQEEDGDQFALELSSLQSLKGLVSLSPYDSVQDDSPTSIVRIPGSSVASSVGSDDLAIRDGSPTSTVRVQDPSISISASCKDTASKGTSAEKEIVPDGNKTNTGANLALRPRAVLSSPDNDTIIGSTNKMRKELLSTERNHNLCQNRHTQCKVMPRPVQKGSNKARASTITGRGRKDQHAGGQLVNKDSSKISTHLKGKTEPQLVNKDSSKISTHLKGKTEPLPRKTSIKPTNNKWFP